MVFSSMIFISLWGSSQSCIMLSRIWFQSWFFEVAYAFQAWGGGVHPLLDLFMRVLGK